MVWRPSDQSRFRFSSVDVDASPMHAVAVERLGRGPGRLRLLMRSDALEAAAMANPAPGAWCGHRPAGPRRTHPGHRETTDRCGLCQSATVRVAGSRSRRDIHFRVPEAVDPLPCAGAVKRLVEKGSTGNKPD
jgi:hypothetical protein